MGFWTMLHFPFVNLFGVFFAPWMVDKEIVQEQLSRMKGSSNKSSDQPERSTAGAQIKNYQLQEREEEWL